MLLPSHLSNSPNQKEAGGQTHEAPHPLTHTHNIHRIGRSPSQFNCLLCLPHGSVLHERAQSREASKPGAPNLRGHRQGGPSQGTAGAAGCQLWQLYGPQPSEAPSKEMLPQLLSAIATLAPADAKQACPTQQQQPQHAQPCSWLTCGKQRAQVPRGGAQWSGASCCSTGLKMKPYYDRLVGTRVRGLPSPSLLAKKRAVSMPRICFLLNGLFFRAAHHSAACYGGK